MTVRSARPEDCHAVNEMMVRLIDEIYARESEEVRRALKANFTEGALQELCGEEHAILYVVEDGGRIVAFLYGWYFRYVLTIYWIYSLREFRGKGVVKALLSHAETTGDSFGENCFTATQLSNERKYRPRLCTFTQFPGEFQCVLFRMRKAFSYHCG